MVNSFKIVGEYKTSSSNIEVLSEFRGLPSLSPSLLQAAGVYILGNCAIGARISQKSFSQTAGTLEGKLSVITPSADSRVVLEMRQSEDQVKFSCGFLFTPVFSKALAAKVIFSPGYSTFFDKVGVEVAVANQVTASTLVKTRYFSAQNTIGFGFAHLLSKSILLEFGADIPVIERDKTKFSLKLLFS